MSDCILPYHLYPFANLQGAWFLSFVLFKGSAGATAYYHTTYTPLQTCRGRGFCLLCFLKALQERLHTTIPPIPFCNLPGGVVFFLRFIKGSAGATAYYHTT